MKASRIAAPGLILMGLVAALAGITDGIMAAEGGGVADDVQWEPAGVLITTDSTDEEGRQGRMASSATDGGDSAAMLAVQPEPLVPDDPYLEQQWALKYINISQLSGSNIEDGDVLVAVLDTGVDCDHEDLMDRVVAAVNFTNSLVADDCHGHGTHIAGIIAANSNNGRGIAGVAPVSRIMSVKVVNDDGKAQVEAVASGIIWAVDNGASVINVSVEFAEPSLMLEDAVDYAWNQGVVVVAAAGNRGSELPVYPAYYENCIAVAACEQSGALAPLSNYGDWVDVIAPGFVIYSTLPSGGYGYKSGTSFAAAHISGLAALLFPIVNDADGDGMVNDEVRAAIEAGCWRPGASKVDM